MDNYKDWMIQPNSQRINLVDTIKLILNFNEDQLDLVWASIEKIEKLQNEWVILIKEKHSKIINHFM